MARNSGYRRRERFSESMGESFWTEFSSEGEKRRYEEATLLLGKAGQGRKPYFIPELAKSFVKVDAAARKADSSIQAGVLRVPYGLLILANVNIENMPPFIVEMNNTSALSLVSNPEFLELEPKSVDFAAKKVRREMSLDRSDKFTAQRAEQLFSAAKAHNKKVA